MGRATPHPRAGEVLPQLPREHATQRRVAQDVVMEQRCRGVHAGDDQDRVGGKRVPTADQMHKRAVPGIVRGTRNRLKIASPRTHTLAKPSATAMISRTYSSQWVMRAITSSSP